MRSTKTIILGIIGVFVTVYMVLIGLNVYDIQTHKNELEHCFSRVMEQTLEACYMTKTETEAIQMLQQELSDSLSKEEELEVEVLYVDLQKGILSAVAREEISLLTGNKKSISFEKTILMDRKSVNESQVTVEFWAEGELYKKYTFAKGEICPMPKLPKNISGWVEDGKEVEGKITEIGVVWQDKIYVGIN